MTDKTLDLQLEPLERRQLLDGNVNVVLTNAGDLRITGDNDGNEILVELIGSSQVQVTSTDGGQTTINGSSSYTSPTGRTIRDLRINMRGGDDIVGVEKELSLFSRSFRNGTINGGSGNDEIGMGVGDNAGTVVFSGNLRLVLGGGVPAEPPPPGTSPDPDQFVVLGSVEIGRNLTVRGSATADTVSVGDGETPTIGGRTIISLGGRDDTVAFADVEMTGAVRISMGVGDDNLALNDTTAHGSFRALGGPGVDTYIASNFSAPNSDPVIRGFGP